VISIEVALGQRSYPIHIGPALLANADFLAASIGAAQILLVSNDVVAPLYLERVTRALAGRRVETVIVADGERHKTLETFAEIIDRLIDARFHRDCCVVALGGGVVGDVAGFAAACYQRGVDLVQIPTTLLAQVDSSVGGKTAVNHPHAKNMIGAFHQPVCVIADTDTLATLPPRELAAGLAEVIKYGLIEDAGLFAWLEKNIGALLALDPDALSHAIRRSCEIKAGIVAEDERERGRRALLNFGHTFAHALESLGGYRRWLHGEAVAIGMQMAANASLALGRLHAEDHRRIGALLRKAGLPTRAEEIDVDAVLELMQIDKKAGRAGLRLVLLDGLGKAEVTPAPDRAVLADAIAAQVCA
jgi:3-dehydroquinate synthase